MNRFYYLSRHLSLKAKLKGSRQEVKRLKKLLLSTKKTHSLVLEDYHNVEIYLQKELTKANETITELRKKKWYQFKKIN